MPMTTTIKTSTLIGRINRKLAAEGERLCVTRERDRGSLGDYHAVNDRNAVTAQHVDPEQWGRELGVIATHERVAAE